MIVHDVKQKSDEWFAVRLGKFTASNFYIFFSDGKTKENELYKKASEILIKKKCDSDNITNINIARGITLEDEARKIYELESGNVVQELGFIEYSSYVGSSPDGFVGDDGIIEIKCKDNHTFIKQINLDDVDKNHIIQIQFNLFVCERKWCDYVVYNENYI